MLFTMNPIERLSQDARITVRKSGAPDPAGKCVIYWMQRAQRAIDNPALDVAIRAGNELKKQVVVFLAPVPFYPRANRLCEAGEFEFGLRYFGESTAMYRESHQKLDLSNGLQNWTGLLIILGRLSDAERQAREAVAAASSTET